MRLAGSTVRFYLALWLIGGLYVALIVAMLLADLKFTSLEHVENALASPPIRYAIKLSLVSCFVTTILSLWVAEPLGYLLSRTQFIGKPFVDTILDIPVVLPPLVIGLSLLILFQTDVGTWVEHNTQHRMGQILTYGAIPITLAAMAWFVVGRNLSTEVGWSIPAGVAIGSAAILASTGLGPSLDVELQARFGTPITYAIPSVILAQFSVSAAFAVRTMRVTFDQISPRTEQVALTLGCTRSQAFWMVSVPEAGRGIVSAACIAWARALGEFGPILVFAGATRMRTEVLSTTVFLELSIGKMESAIAVSLLMVVVAVFVLLLMRGFGLRNSSV